MKAIADALRALADAVEAYRPVDPLVRLDRRERLGARCGEFSAYRDGKVYVAKRSELEAWCMRNPVRVKEEAPMTDIDAEYEALCARPYRKRK